MPKIPPIYLREPPDNLSIDIEELQKFDSVSHLMRHFKTDEIARQFLEVQRWHGEPRCPYCDATGPYRTDRGFKCRARGCYQKFTVTVGTIYENAKKLRYWFGVIYLASMATRPISSIKIARKLGLTQKVVYYMLKKIRDMPKPEPKQKNPDAVALGRLGGLKGGNARAANLTADERRAIAKKGGEAKRDKAKPVTTSIMSDNIDKDRRFNELRRQYLARAISLEALLKQIPETGEILSILVREDGSYACITYKWIRYTFAENGTGADLHTWVPIKYWKPTLRAAVVYTLNKLHKEKNNLLFEDMDEEKEDD